MNASEIINLFLPQMHCIKNLILSEAAIRSLVTAAMLVTILDAAEFLDSWIHLWHLTTGETMVTLLSMLFLLTKFILIFGLKN